MSAETAVCRDRGIVLCGGNVYYLVALIVHWIKLGTKYARIFDMKPIKENPKFQIDLVVLSSSGIMRSGKQLAGK